MENKNISKKRSRWEDELAEKLDERAIQKLALKLYEKKKGFSALRNALYFLASGIALFFEFTPRKYIRRLHGYIEFAPGYDWREFNLKYLKRQLRKLEKSKLVKIKKVGKEKYAVEITRKGKVKLLKYSLEDMKIERPEIWDGSWWLVSYDLPESMRKYRDFLRNFFRRLGFCPIHKSLYLHAFPCKEQIEFLREFFGVGRYIKIFKVEEIENEEVYKKFFGLK